MIRNSDVRWWIQEARNNPESAPMIIETLARRLIELDALNEHLRDELIQLRRRATKRTTKSSDAQVAVLQRQVQALHEILERHATSEASLVLLSDRAQSAALFLSRARELAATNQPILGAEAAMGVRGLAVAAAGDRLILLTNQGRGLKLTSADIPAPSQDLAWPEESSAGLLPQERLATAACFGSPPRFWTVVTRHGYVQRLVAVAVERQIGQGAELYKSPHRNDAAISLVPGDRGDLLVITRWGSSVRFAQRAIETHGSQALELEPDDRVATALALPEDTEVLVVTASGYVMRRDTGQLAARSRPGGSGRRLIQARDVLAAFPFAPEAQLVFLRYTGELLLVPVQDVPLYDRSSRGTLLYDLSRDPALAVTLASDVA